MKEKKVKEISDVLELMKANQNFDVKQFEEILSELEHIVGNELDRSDEQKMEKLFAENVQKAILNALDGKPSLDMISIAEQIIAQAGGEYKALKTKYMNDAIDFFLNYLSKPGDAKTVEKEIDEELDDTDDEQS